MVRRPPLLSPPISHLALSVVPSGHSLSPSSREAQNLLPTASPVFYMSLSCNSAPASHCSAVLLVFKWPSSGLSNSKASNSLASRSTSSSLWLS
ncbi:hypothetical protein B0H12DRAFT_1111718 [Mycena haematopus]|nr:hypothetical protein B0H12DRAFT_1170679 [Mycena haematopus]KAJ7256797.1 hypothetical protein B0H12DRAFT_1111718 [Mycena haematopus]